MAPSKIATRSSSRRKYSDTIPARYLSHLVSGPIIHCRTRESDKCAGVALVEDAQPPQRRNRGGPPRSGTAVDHLGCVAIALRNGRGCMHSLRAGFRDDIPRAGDHQLGVELAGSGHVLGMSEHRIAHDSERLCVRENRPRTATPAAQRRSQPSAAPSHKPGFHSRRWRRATSKRRRRRDARTMRESAVGPDSRRSSRSLDRPRLPSKAPECRRAFRSSYYRARSVPIPLRQVPAPLSRRTADACRTAMPIRPCRFYHKIEATAAMWNGSPECEAVITAISRGSRSNRSRTPAAIAAAAMNGFAAERRKIGDRYRRPARARLRRHRPRRRRRGEPTRRIPRGIRQRRLRRLRSNERGFDDRGFLLREDGITQVSLAGIASEGYDRLAAQLRTRRNARAAQTFAPVEMPTSMPSSRASRRAVAIASASVTRTTS